MRPDRFETFWEGARAAIPICVAFFAITFALGIAAHASGVTLAELSLMSALVFAGPAQFPAVDLLPLGGHGLQIILGTFFINLRFAIMGFALSPHFKGIRRGAMLFSAQLISLSTFALSFLRFQRRSDASNLAYFLGVAIPSYTVYLLGTVLGYLVGLGIPTGFEEGIRFIFPGYLTALLAAELREPRTILLVVIAFLTTPLCEAVVPGWGLIVNAVVVATVAVGVETWSENGSPLS